jgi:GT2 family glycosyltransferase
VSELTLLVAWPGGDVAGLRARAARKLSAAVLVADDCAVPAVARNSALRRCQSERVALVEPDDDLDFIARALLEADVDFVTAGVVGPCGPAELLARPLAAQLPALFHRRLWEELGGFDERLPACEDTDLWLRALAAGKRGRMIAGEASEWGRPSLDERAVRLLLAKHHETALAHHAGILTGKERWLRHFDAHTRALHQRRLARERELAALREQALKLREQLR